MARPDQEAIATFMSITGVSEAAAVQKLEEHHGSLNEAVNAYFTEGDRNIAQGAFFGVPRDDSMDIDDPIPVESHRPQSFLPPFARDANHFSPLESARTSHISNPIPVEITDGTGASAWSGSAPIVEEITETADGHGSGIRQPVIIDDGDDDGSNPDVRNTEVAGHGNQGSSVQHGASVPTVIDVPDDADDIEEEMIRAAIEASKQDAAMSNQQYNHLDLGDPPQPVQPSQREDAELAHVVSLSLQTAEKEKVLEELEKVGTSRQQAQNSSSPDDLQRLTSSDERLPQLGMGSAYVQDENEDVEERPLVRQRRRRMTSSSSGTTLDVGEAEVKPPSSPQPNNDAHHPEQNASVFPSDEWGGISSVEHDEAVMLEAAMFGGIPEGSGYHFPRAPHQMMQNGFHRDAGPNPWSIPRPPSPSLTAQRLIREQQDDEYFASLQADREKELKAKEEAEAALAEERRKEEEFRRKQREEEEIERQLAAKEASLPQEPSTDDENAITLLVRMPDGSRRGRRFHKSDKLQCLFDFIDVGRGVTPGSYKLVRTYPTRAFSDGDSNSTLNELGLTSKQEALYLDLI